MRWRIPGICDTLFPEGHLQNFQIPICLCECADSSCMPLHNWYGFRTLVVELPPFAISPTVCPHSHQCEFQPKLFFSHQPFFFICQMEVSIAETKEISLLTLCWLQTESFSILQRILNRSVAAGLWQTRKHLSGNKKWWDKTYIDTTVTCCLPCIEHTRPLSFSGETFWGSGLLSAKAWISTGSACNHCSQHLRLWD